MSESILAPEQEVSALTGEVLRHGFIAVTEEMKSNLMRTAYNMIIYEALDFTVGLFDRRGDTISIGLGLPMFIRGMSDTVKATIAELGADDFRPGDIYVTNDAYTTGSHLNHVTLTLPLFHEGQLFGFTATMAHWEDIGGVLNGVTTDIYSEGLQIPIMRLYSEGELNDDLVRIIRQNVRLPELAVGDLRAEIAAVRTGEKRTMQLVENYGIDNVVAAMRYVADRSTVRAAAAVEQIPDGEYFAESFMDDDGVSEDPIPIRVRVVVEGAEMTIDLSDVGAQVEGFYNAGRSAGLSAAQVAFTCIVDPKSRPINHGTFKALNVVLGDRTVVSAEKPAAMRWWMTVPMTVVDTIFKALSQAIPERIAAGHHADLNVVDINGIKPNSGQFYRCTGGLVGGGWGAKGSGDGVSATICINDGDTHNAPIESIESKFPHVVIKQELRRDSGGAGRHRGGLGVIQERQMLSPAKINAQIERTQQAPWGLYEGRDASPNAIELRLSDGRMRTFKTAKVLDHDLGTGESYVLSSGGGGGFGNPLERPVEVVANDVYQGYVSAEAARRDYGVVVDPATGELDLAATEALRVHGAIGGD
jgi:N-methylhydantoinase B